jgi:hypothetical protein
VKYLAKKGKTTNYFFPSSFVVVRSGMDINRDPGFKKIWIRDLNKKK